MAYKYTIKGIRKFNEHKVVERTRMLFNTCSPGMAVLRKFRSFLDNEMESFTLMAEKASTQGVSIKLLIGGNITVELPWFASECDVRLCYAFLNAVMRIHRMARIVDEDERTVRLTDCDADEQWTLRRRNMANAISKGERMTLAGVNRDFYLEPSFYLLNAEYTGDTMAAFEDFALSQWAGLERKEVKEEQRHVADDEELSSVRVVDNQDDVFVGACQYVGMMRKNTCKMVRFEDFCQLMDGVGEFRRLDAAQAFLDRMDDVQWDELFGKARGIVRENFRKTFIMRWNTDISNHTMVDFEDSMANFDDEGFYYDWSIWDFKKAHVGDKFYMIRTGKGVNGVVMKGTLTDAPYMDEDWSGKGRKVYYVRMALSHIIHPDKASLVLTTDALSAAIPSFNWSEGHSGEMLTDEEAILLDRLWEKYVKRLNERHEKVSQARLVGHA